MTLPDDPGSRYALRVDTGLDAACVEPVRYALRAVPFQPVPPTVGSTGVVYNGVACGHYRALKRQLDRKIKRTSAKKRAKLRKLRKQRRSAVSAGRKACTKPKRS
jgi:hypothetical protein